MKRNILLCIIMVLYGAANAAAQDGYNERAKKYIETYYEYALEEQKVSGIPAAVSLGQGILETEAGNSELMVKANNHFGIKCKSDWNGPYILHTDDAKNEHFKKYESAQESYRDHSDLLHHNPRYSMLFSLSQTDYASWAVGLRRCGYATNPHYAQQLIKIIEDFKLQEYTYAALDSPVNYYPSVHLAKKPRKPSVQPADPLIDGLDKEAEVTVQAPPPPVQPVAPAPATVVVSVPAAAAPPAPVTQDTITMSMQAPAPVVPVVVTTPDSAHIAVVPATDNAAMPAPTDPGFDSTKVVTVNGLRAFYAYKNDMLLQQAIRYNVRYAQLLEMNDLADEPLPASMYIYLQKKSSTGAHNTHTVADGETLLTIAQAEGMQLKKLAVLNQLYPTELPITGTVLQLQTPAAKRPEIRITETVAHPANNILSATDTVPVREDDYITINKTGADNKFPPVVDRTASQPDRIIGVNQRPAVAAPTTVKVADTITVAPVNKMPEAPVAKKITAEQIPAEQPAVAVARNTPPAPDTKKKEDLDALKARMDKVVYADDSKAPSMKDDPQQPQLKLETPPEDPNKSNKKFYTVKKGDTAFAIARQNGITVQQLMKWNSIDVEDIHPGQTLKIKE